MTQKEIVNALNKLAHEVDEGIMSQEWDTCSMLARLKDACADITLLELSNRTGINTSNLSLILHGKRVPRLDTFVAIAKAVGMEIECRK